MKSKMGSVQRVPAQDAAQFMDRFEVLGNVGLAVWHWGLVSGGQLVSVVSFGTTCFSPRRGFLGGIASQANCRILQLCRGATAPEAPRNSPSHLLSTACNRIYKDMGCLLIVAYADPNLGETGTIYQACNAIYTGMTDPGGQANYIVLGKSMSGWQVRKKYGTRSRARLSTIDPDVKILPLTPKHRYVLLACPRRKKRHVRRLLAPRTLPYPNKHG